MATYLIDTTIVIDALNRKRNRPEILISLAQQGHTLACSPVTIAEVYAGMRPKEEKHTTGFLHSLELYPITFPVAELAGQLKRDYNPQG
jgi:predicted nucleic acid-binding protein